MNWVKTLGEHPFVELAVLLGVMCLAGALALRARQPILIAYILMGVGLGPAGLALVQPSNHISLLSQVGITVLLFIVGLKLDWKYTKEIGPVALATGLGQLAFTIAFGFLITLGLGKSPLEATYIAIALTFSSTIIIVKLLSDKRELDSLHGRIAIGFLIVQDLAVILAMMVVSGSEALTEGSSLAFVLVTLVLKVAASAVVLYFLMRYLLGSVVAFMAKSVELLTLFAIAWGAMLAVGGEFLGFGKEAGAFLAGFSLASSGYREAINSRLSGVRDFMLLFFFVDLGAKLNFSVLGDELWSGIILSLFVLIGNPLIVMGIMGWMGYRKRTGFMAGLTVAQISEFSIIFVAMGITLGHVGLDVLGLTAVVGLTTITSSTYMIIYSHPLFDRLSPFLSIFERKKPFRELNLTRGQDGSQKGAEVVVFGLGRYGGRVVEDLHKRGVNVTGFDFDPTTVRRLQNQGLPVLYGDAEDQDFLKSLELNKTRWVICALSMDAALQAVIVGLQGLSYDGKIAALARDSRQVHLYKHFGVDRILQPFVDAAHYTANMVCEDLRGAAKGD